MRALDPFSLLVAGAILTAGLAMILMVTRVGMREDCRGLRTMMACLVLAFLGQVGCLADVSAFDLGFQMPPVVVSSGLNAAALTLHWLAIRRHTGGTTSIGRVASVAAVVGAATACACLLSDDIAVRSTISHLLLALLLALPVVTLLEPAQNSWGARMFMAVCILGVVGNMTIAFASTRPDFSVHDEAVSGLVVALVMSLLACTAMLLWFQEELSNRLRSLAITDTLTGALNRRGLLPQLRREIARSGRAGHPMSIVICDLDHFKKINDTHGHKAGDTVLKAFVSRAQAVFRAPDLVARWGGEEFLFVMPDTALDEAVIAVERLKEAQRPASDSLPLVSFSAGVSSTNEYVGLCDLDELIALADSRLYVAKETRNRVVGGAAATKPAVRRPALSETAHTAL